MNYFKILSQASALLTFAFLTGISPSVASTIVGGIEVLDPDELLAGKTQAEWGNLWWQYLYEIPFEQSPVFDDNGENANVNQSGPVYFLSGSFVADADDAGDFISTVTRNVTISTGKSLFFPILNLSPDNVNEEIGFTVEELRARADEEGIQNVLEDELFVTINGVSVPNISSYRQKSPAPFSYTIPEDNILGVELGDVVNNPNSLGGPYTIEAFPATIFPSVSDGFWVGTGSLPRGNHVVKFGGTVTGLGENQDLLFKLDITYNITSTSIPEPASSLGLLALGTIGTAFTLRRGLRNIL